MKEQTRKTGTVSRRRFLGSAAAAAAAATVLPLVSSCTTAPAPSAKAGAVPNSNFNGVQIGCITYSFRALEPGIEGVIKACAESGCSSIELMPTGIEAFCGAPAAPVRQQQAAPAPVAAPAAAGTVTTAPPPPPPPPAPAAGAPGAVAPAPAQGGGGGGRQQIPLTPEEQAAQDKYVADLKAWRMNPPMEKFAELKKMFNDAGVDIHIVKWSPSRWTDEEIEYAFITAKALGAKAVCEEWGLDAAKKLGPVAEKHGMKMVFHNHAQWGQNPNFEAEVVEPALAASPAVMFNFDIGHFGGSTGRHPIEIIDKFKDRIFSLHLKDKTGPNTTPPNTNQVWGQGETKLEDVLLKVRDEKLPYYCDIELEYSIAPWSNSVKEVRTCVNYARQILI